MRELLGRETRLNERMRELAPVVDTVKELKFKQEILLDFVKEGKTMLVQYNTTDEIVTKNIAPFPLKISRDRVTEENAEVRFLAPEHPVLNYPNKITSIQAMNYRPKP